MTQTNTYKKEYSFKDYLAKTYSTVAIGVAISAILAVVTAKLLPVLMVKAPGFVVIGSFAAIIIELVIAFYFSANLTKMNKSTAWFCYILYSAVTGLSFGSIIMLYTNASVALAFASTAIMFACMSIIGHTSNMDFTKVYAIFLPAVIAGIIATILNALIFHAPALDMMIVYIGLILFLIITAADVQQLKSYYYGTQNDSELSEKFMVMGAFQLYLDFANLFIRIVQIFGRRRND